MSAAWLTIVVAGIGTFAMRGVVPCLRAPPG